MHPYFPVVRMMDVARKLDKADRDALLRCAMYLKKMQQYAYAAEIYTKLGDTKGLVMLRVEAQHWEDVSACFGCRKFPGVFELKLAPTRCNLYSSIVAFIRFIHFCSLTCYQSSIVTQKVLVYISEVHMS